MYSLQDDEVMVFSTYFIAFGALIAAATAVEPQECPGPNEWFTSEFVSLADKLVPADALDLTPDVDLRFFREIMFFSEEEIEESTKKAIEFFNTVFGLDFSDSQPDEFGQRLLGNATFFPFDFSPLSEYTVTFHRWIINGRSKPLCFNNRAGGFAVTFSSDQILYGTYGGAEGKPIKSGEVVVWGYFKIPVCPQQPLVIQYQSATPYRVVPEDGIYIINLDVHHRELGAGIAQGLEIVSPTQDPNILHLSSRIVFTFPTHPGLPDN